MCPATARVRVRVLLAAVFVWAGTGCSPNDGSEDDETPVVFDSGNSTTNDVPETEDGSIDARDATVDGTNGDSGQTGYLARRFETFRDEHGVPGVAGTVFESGDVVERATAGLRKKGGSEKVRIDDPFHLGSVTKSMTATVFGRFVDRGELAWDDTLDEMLPNLGDEMHQGYRDVTLAQLLRHEAGLPSPFPDPIWSYMWDRGSEDLVATRKEVTRRLLTDPPANSTGEYEYANASYVVAGRILEQMSDTGWEELTRRELFEPLEMRECGFGPPATPGTVDAPWGHRSSSGSLEPVPPGEARADNPPSMGPAGTVHCPVPQWRKFADLHLGFGPSDYLSDATLSELQRPSDSPSNPAAGWIVAEREWAAGRGLVTSGSNTMFYALAALAPEREFGILIAINAGNETLRQAVIDLLVDVRKHYFG